MCGDVDAMMKYCSIVLEVFESSQQGRNDKREDAQYQYHMPCCL